MLPPSIEASWHLDDLAKYGDSIPGDARTTCAQLKQDGRMFGFAFVGHSHTYELIHYSVH